jgi:ABC-2 type transport system permease protein
MLKAIKHYKSVYDDFISTNFSVAMSFRTSFVLLILMDIFFYLSTLLTVEFIFQHISTIGPWNKDQLMFFISFMLVIDNLHMAILSESFWVLAHQIKTGDVDFILLKPVHSIFTIFFRFPRPSSILNSFLTLGVLIYYGSKLSLGITDWILLPLFVLMSFILLAILEIIISTSMFWMQEGLGINFLRMQMQQLSRWPDYIYSKLAKRTFLVAFPILLVGSAPIHYLFDHSKWYYLLGELVAIIFSFGVMLKVWNLALMRYESASS